MVGSTVKERLEEFIRRKDFLKETKKRTASGHKSVVVSFSEILDFDKDLANGLLDSPSDILDWADKKLEEITGIPNMHLRVYGLPETVEIRNIRADHVGKFIQVDGILTKAGEVKPEAREAVFKCRFCGEENRVIQAGEFFREPLSCENPNCRRKGAFELVIESTVFRDWQSISVQEPPEKLRGGRIPQKLDGILRDDFVDRAVPGNHVTVTGVLKVFHERQKRERRTTFRKILFVNHIDVRQKGVEETELTPEDEKKISELAKDPWLRNKIIQSIAPAIHGHEVIKEAVALQLFGCNPVELQDGTRIRGDVHILLCGDPGTAKSQILKWVSNVAPRGLYTSGMKTTAAGITAAAVRDEIGGGWALEAGALVIADGGIACVDEFEKMDAQESSAILESMEQQTVSIAKAGIVATLNTRTAVLAATNPKYGRFERNIPPPKQLAIEPVLLSRFDLILLLKDEPRPDLDHSIAQHVLQLHSSPKKVTKAPFDVDFLRKIVIYSRKYLDPKIQDKEVMKAIEDFFVEWRKVVSQGAPLPITVRQLESIIRLAKCNARMRLSDRVTVEDANKAVALIKTSLSEAGIDTEANVVDIDLIMTGIPKSQRDKRQRIMDIIGQLEEQYGGAAPISKVKDLASSEGISENFVERMIEEEKKRGYLYSPTPETVSRAVK
ncbi:MAG: minichromosome maintenance protein MCM [Candidatus Hadarchaeales archaeon]